MNGISPFPLEHLTGVSMPHAGTTACKGGMDEIEPIQSSYPYTCYSQEPVYSLLGWQTIKTSPPVHRQTQSTSPKGSQMNVIAEVVA